MAKITKNATQHSTTYECIRKMGRERGIKSITNDKVAPNERDDHEKKYASLLLPLVQDIDVLRRENKRSPLPPSWILIVPVFNVVADRGNARNRQEITIL